MTRCFNGCNEHGTHEAHGEQRRAELKGPVRCEPAVTPSHRPVSRSPESSNGIGAGATRWVALQ